jgi:replicative DNA helicase
MTKRPDSFAHDEVSERAALGAMLIDGSQWPDFAAAVKRDDLFLVRNRVVYDVCQELYERNEAIDRVTVHHGLSGRGDSIGGPAYLQELLNFHRRWCIWE